MSTLTAANQARLKKSLDKLIRYDGRVMTTEQFINEVAVDLERSLNLKYTLTAESLTGWTGMNSTSITKNWKNEKQFTAL